MRAPPYRKSGRRSDFGARGIVPEYVFDASRRAAAGHQVDELVPASVEGKNDLFGLRDLERISAEPVEPVADGRHTAGLTVSAVTLPRIAPPHDVGRQVADDVIRDERCADDEATEWSRAVEALDLGPAARPEPLIVVDGDEEPATGSDALARGVDGVPHGARVVQDAPRVDDVELSERLHEVRIEHR